MVVPRDLLECGVGVLDCPVRVGEKHGVARGFDGPAKAPEFALAGLALGEVAVQRPAHLVEAGADPLPLLRAADVDCGPVLVVFERVEPVEQSVDLLQVAAVAPPPESGYREEDDEQRPDLESRRATNRWLDHRPTLLDAHRPHRLGEGGISYDWIGPGARGFVIDHLPGSGADGEPFRRPERRGDGRKKRPLGEVKGPVERPDDLPVAPDRRAYRDDVVARLGLDGFAHVRLPRHRPLEVLPVAEVTPDEVPALPVRQPGDDVRHRSVGGDDRGPGKFGGVHEGDECCALVGPPVASEGGVLRPQLGAALVSREAGVHLGLDVVGRLRDVRRLALLDGPLVQLESDQNRHREDEGENDQPEEKDAS